MREPRFPAFSALGAGALLTIAAIAVPRVCAAEDARPAPRTVEEYRYFRALAVDLLGRVPSRTELTAFERRDFDMGAWVEGALRGDGYVDRISRIYMDVLRLDVNPLVTYTPPPAMLFAETVKDDAGKLTRVFYRRGQRRVRDLTDGDFCLTRDESGVDTTKPRVAVDALPKTKREALDQNTVLVRPWWLYRDYRAAHPSERFGHGWRPPLSFVPTKDLLLEPDGKTEVTEIRVCREEAQTSESGTLWVSARPKGIVVTPPPARTSRYPFDDPYARDHAKQPVACATQLAFAASVDCGCGPGLERCLPNAQDYALMFTLPPREAVGLDGAIGAGPQQISHWQRWWWRQEALAIFKYVLAQDRDVRELVTGRYTYVNGPLAQFYRYVEPAACCGHERSLAMRTEDDPLFLPERVPHLLAHDVDVWTFVPDRGPRAAGILTTPAFLEKFASRRARAAAAYSGLLCKNFVADTSSSPPTRNPNLMTRAGCASCHATLEPLAAYFGRVKEGSTTFLSLPVENAECKLQKDGKLRGYCPEFYDADFSTDSKGVLRGAYGSHDNVEQGPAALGAAIASSPDYLRCVVEQVTSSFLGRSLSADDDDLRVRLERKLSESGNRMRALVRALVLDPVYADARLGPVASVSPAAVPFVHPPIPGGTAP